MFKKLTVVVFTLVLVLMPMAATGLAQGPEWCEVEEFRQSPVAEAEEIELWMDCTPGDYACCYSQTVGAGYMYGTCFCLYYRDEYRIATLCYTWMAEDCRNEARKYCEDRFFHNCINPSDNPYYCAREEQLCYGQKYFECLDGYPEPPPDCVAYYKTGGGIEAICTSIIQNVFNLCMEGSF